mmetsp:Transcript_14690/g.33964  ORF Transcript_14690/g.33964 Transcript_14690/m.33964 type:complete len:153 (-) Transcript_14690:128-586(-)
MNIFTSNDAVYNEIKESCPAAAIVRNDSVIQVGYDSLPHGGLGTSGYGNYHGRFSFECFTHARPEVSRPLFCRPYDDLGLLRYNPFPPFKARLLEQAMWMTPDTPPIPRFWVVIGLVVVLVVMFPDAAMSQTVKSVLADGLEGVVRWLRNSQ